MTLQGSTPGFVTAGDNGAGKLVVYTWDVSSTPDPALVPVHHLQAVTEVREVSAFRIRQVFKLNAHTIGGTK